MWNQRITCKYFCKINTCVYMVSWLNVLVHQPMYAYDLLYFKCTRVYKIVAVMKLYVKAWIIYTLTLQAAGTGTVSNDFLELLLFGTPRYESHRNTCRYERNKTTGKIGDQVLRLLLFGTPWSESHRNRY